MKPLDRLLQRWRIAVARPWIEPGSRVLDVGCADGALFRQLGDRIGSGVGVDPDLEERASDGRIEWIPGRFPEGLDGVEPFDVITMLAVLEHVPRERQSLVAEGCAVNLVPGGRLVITTPAPIVDRILDALAFLRLIDGMSLEEHYGFEPRETYGIFSGAALELERSRRFQLGLNHLFVFRRR